MSNSSRHRFDGRLHAVVFVLGSGVFLFLLAWTMQAFAWEAKSFARALNRQHPRYTELFVEMFGMRPHGHMFSVTLWFWWPMVGSLIYCLCRYRQPREFNIAFLYWMSLCWLLVAIGVAASLALVSMMGYILLADFEQPPSFMRWVPVVSYILPIIVLFVSGFFFWRHRLREHVTR